MGKGSGPKKDIALSIKSLRYGESSRIITFFGEQCGKFAAMAKGVRRGKSNFSASAIEPLSLSELVVYFKPNRSVQILAQATLLESFDLIKNDLILNTFAAAALELLNQAFTEGESNPVALKAIIDYLHILQSKNEDPYISLWRFQLKLLEIMGFAIDPFICPACMKNPADVGRQNHLNLKAGAICCEKCKLDDDEILSMSGEAVNIMRIIVKDNREVAKRLKLSIAVRSELTSILYKFFRFHHPSAIYGTSMQMLEKFEKIQSFNQTSTNINIK